MTVYNSGEIILQSLETSNVETIALDELIHFTCLQLEVKSIFSLIVKRF